MHNGKVDILSIGTDVHVNKLNMYQCTVSAYCTTEDWWWSTV